MKNDETKRHLRKSAARLLHGSTNCLQPRYPGRLPTLSGKGCPGVIEPHWAAGELLTRARDLVGRFLVRHSKPPALDWPGVSVRGERAYAAADVAH